jgi:hypothetical protein
MVMFCHASLAAVVLLQPVLVEVVMVETGLMSSKLLVVTEEGIIKFTMFEGYRFRCNNMQFVYYCSWLLTASTNLEAIKS